MNSKKLLIFDFDGTLADTVPHVIHCIQKCAKHFSLKEVSYEDVEKLNGSVLADAMRALGAVDSQLPEIRKYYGEIFLEDLSDVILYDGVKETLSQLKREGYTLALATNRGSNTLFPLLEFLGLKDLFTKVVCEDHVVNRKPSPDMVDLILEDLHFQKEDTLVLGDTLFDILMAQNAGCSSCYVCHSENPSEHVMAGQPDFIIYRFQELVQKSRG